MSMVLLGVLLAACGGDDADPTATVAPLAATATVAPAEAEPTATATEEPAEPTATEVPPTPTTEPTVEPTATATEPAATPTTAATATVEPTEDAAAPTGETDIESDPVVEAALLDMLLTEEELPEEYLEVFSGPVGVSGDGLEFCNEPSFSSPENRLASVEAEFERNPDFGPFLLQSLTAYPDDVATEAFDYVRTITSNCADWEDEDGLTYYIEVIEMPDYGDESHGLSMTFEVVEGIEAEVRFSLARFGGVLLAMGYIVVFDGDFAEFDSIVELAVDKIEAADFQP